jgi:hypothetical protein
MSRSNHCPHCHNASLRRPPRGGAIVVALAWAFVAAMLFVSSLLGPILVGVLPLIFAFGASAVRAAPDVAFAWPECGRCGKVVLEDGPVAAPARQGGVVARAA